MIIYLYVKTHIHTGLKYLGKTSSSDPHSYRGSGTDWKIHLKEYGNNYTTEIIKECQSNQELNNYGRYYSDLWDIVKSTEWANRIAETGGGGYMTPETAKKLSNQLKGKKKPPRTKEHSKKLGDSLRGKSRPALSAKLAGRILSNEHVENISSGIKNWYQNNPEMAKEKSVKTWDGIYRQNYEKYKSVSILIGTGKTNREITKLIKIDPATIRKLRTGNHPIFELFPELKKYLFV